MQHRNDGQIERSIQRLVDQQQAFNSRLADGQKDSLRRISDLEEGFVLLSKLFDAYVLKTDARLERKNRRIYWLGVGLMLVSFLFLVMVIASFFR